MIDRRVDLKYKNIELRTLKFYIRKILNMSPGLIEVSKNILGWLIFGGGAYIRRAFCVSV